MPNWYPNSMGWIVSFLRYGVLRLFWTLRGQGRNNVIKKYRGGLNAHSALNAHTSPRAAAATQPSPSAKRKLASPNPGGVASRRSTLDGHDERGNKRSRPSFLWRVCGHQIRIQTNQTANMRKRVIREILSTFMKQRT